MAGWMSVIAAVQERQKYLCRLAVRAASLWKDLACAAQSSGAGQREEWFCRANPQSLKLLA